MWNEIGNAGYKSNAGRQESGGALCKYKYIDVKARPAQTHYVVLDVSY